MNAEILKKFENYAGNPRKLKSAIGDYICSLGVNPSEQYIMVLEYLYTNRTHPTVEEIYHALSLSDPLMSRSRIYSILEILSRAGAIQTIHIDKHTTHYDGDTSMHAHFVCARCGEVKDMEMKRDISPVATAPRGAVIYDMNLICTGECKKCREENVC